MIGALTTHLWQSTWFAFAAAALTLAFRGNRAKVRYWLWLSGSLKFFVPFALLISLGSQARWAPAARTIATPQVSIAVERLALPFDEPAGTLAAPAAPTLRWTPVVLGGLWLCGFLTVVAIRLRLWGRVRAALRAGTRLEMPAPVEIRSSPGLLEPGVVGWRRPVLLLPEGILERLTPSELEAVLAHELCHVQRRDNLFAAIHMVVEALFWFHPVVWWIGARLVEERERACDEGVLSMGSQPRIYADAILHICRLYVESPLGCVSGITGANLKRRIEAIMTNRTGQGLNRAKKLLLAAAGAAALAGPVALGVLIGIGHAPIIHAQPAAVAPPAPAPAAALASEETPAAEPQDAPAPPQQAKYKDRRLVAMLFDFDTMQPEDRQRAQQAAARYVQNNMRIADLVAVLAAENGAVRVVEDFTDDMARLEPAIQNLSPQSGTVAAGDSGRALANLSAAFRVLGVLPEKKALMYYSSGTLAAGQTDPTQLQEAVNEAKKANVAIYPIETRGLVAQAIGQDGLGGKLGAAAPGEISQDESSRRAAYAQANYGSTASPRGRTYLRHGPPDRIEEASPKTNPPSEIWHYNYLENFHSAVDFQLSTDSRARGVRILWPQPLATYTSVPGVDAQTAEALAQGGGSGATAATGLPGGRATFQIYPAGESQTLIVPLTSLTGRVELTARISGTATGYHGFAMLHDSNVGGASANSTYEGKFNLQAGSYICGLVVREEATGQTYGETIYFDVK